MTHLSARALSTYCHACERSFMAKYENAYNSAHPPILHACNVLDLPMGAFCETLVLCNKKDFSLPGAYP